MKRAAAGRDCTELHLIFDFAEKILLPHSLRQPGQLHFNTGLNFDLFGTHVNNLNCTSIFCLPEGHWPNSKTGNKVGSMILYQLDVLHEHSRFSTARYLTLHAENCPGENKNLHMLWLLALRSILKKED